MKLTRLFLFLALLAPARVAEAQTGKIAGQVMDAQTGEVLPGVNVIIEGTTQGAVTDGDGYYTILGVSAGTYAVRASFVGYTPQVIEDVRVNIDLTTELDFQLQEATVGLDEMVVTAERPIVQRDVSANVANVNMAEVENVPVTSVEGVVGMQAGIEPGISIRGDGAGQVQFMVDGMSMRDARTNAPFSSISYTSVEEVQVQTGGFNAEYGNVRSGLVNITTKEGPRDRYTADVILRYSPATDKHFGISPDDPTAYWMRPYLDDEVAWDGTGEWDEYTRRQYPDFEGWNSLAERLKEDPDLPDLTPEQAQETFRWYHRKDFATPADYEVDGSVGGPVPGISRYLGDLRFFGSYRQTQGAYIVPQRRDAYTDRTVQMKLTSDIASGMKLRVQGLYGLQQGMSNSPYGGMWNADLPPYPWSGAGMVDNLESTSFSWDLFTLDSWSLADRTLTQIGAHFTHTLSATTFYDLRVQRNRSEYEVGPGPERDFTVIENIGGLELSEEPFGFYNEAQIFDLTGMEIGGRWGTARDSTEVNTWSVRGDLTSQVNRYAQLKTGFDINLTGYDANYGVWNPAQPSVSNPKFIWDRKTTQAAGYAQAKLEFLGMVANLGLRLDYFKPEGEWYDYDTFDEAFAENTLEEEVPLEPIDGQLALSPRLGVSFPITDDSKLYFNYGHFRNTQQIPDLFIVRTIFGGTAIDMVGNPAFPMAKTVAYELGYDQNLFDQFLLRIAGYYKALSDQPRDVRFQSLSGRTSYSKPLPLNYGDTRGLEFSLTRNRGKWVRGFANYTYMVRKSGNFGFNEIYESRAAMRDFIRTSRQHYPSRPVPEPYANLNIEFFAPQDFGPEVAGLHPLSGWNLSFLGEWRAGQTFTWEGGSDLRISDNVSWRDYYNLDLRLSKNFDTNLGRAQFFVDVTNALNIKHMNRYSAFVGSFDFENYMQSLHLPADVFEDKDAPYRWIPGDDTPGDYRDPDVQFVPIEVVGTVEDVEPHTRPLYYEEDNGRYMQWTGSEWQAADEGFVDEVLETKAYIDMPNSAYFSFLNPRNVFFGLRLSF